MAKYSVNVVFMSEEQSNISRGGPLANRMRPTTLDEILGQQHILADGSPLRMLAANDGQGNHVSAPSVILYGPPGSGKTTIASVLAQTSGRKFVQLSALTAGVKDVRDVADKARIDQDLYGVSTILFIDEIHRFSKSQQDSLLPSVEGGWVTLVAATTENPAFSIITPLLSRSLVLHLAAIQPEDIVFLLRRAMSSEEGLAGRFEIDGETLGKIAVLASGDVRRALTILEASANSAAARTDFETTKTGGVRLISEEDVEAAANVALVHYDRMGDQHYDVISAFIKSIRGSDADAAIHYLARMLEAGEDPRFIARRLIISAAEDIGLADPEALTIAVAAAEAVSKIGMPEGRIPLAEATLYLSLAPKSNAAYLAINEAIADVQSGLSGPVPLAMKNNALNKGKNAYLYPHDDPAAVVRQDYVEGKTKERKYFRPKAVGKERDLVERWARIRSIIRGK